MVDKMIELLNIHSGKVHYRRENNDPDVKEWQRLIDEGKASGYYLRKVD